MTRRLLIDEEAIEEAEAETRYYRERGGARRLAIRGGDRGRLSRSRGPTIRRREPSCRAVPPTHQARVSRALSVRSRVLCRGRDGVRRCPGGAPQATRVLAIAASPSLSKRAPGDAGAPGGQS